MEFRFFEQALLSTLVSLHLQLKEYLRLVLKFLSTELLVILVRFHFREIHQIQDEYAGQQGQEKPFSAAINNLFRL